MLKRFFLGFLVFIVMNCFCAKVFAGNSNGSVISNKYFSFTMPKEVQGLYNVIKYENCICIVEKLSQELDAGGFAFGVRFYKSPQDYADMEDYKKVGELTDKNGTLYDMVLIKPREIRYGDRETIEKNYNQLYNLADNIEIKGINGYKYNKGQGMKGEDLYGEVLTEYKSKISKKSLEKVGYVYYDLNSDGVDELFIGKITNGKSKSVIYDIYTTVNRKPKHVVKGGGEDNRYFVCDETFLCNEFSEGKKDKHFEVFTIERNSNKLNALVGYMYNPHKDKKNPWFIKYGNNSVWEKISKQTFNESTNNYTEYKNFRYIPFINMK